MKPRSVILLVWYVALAATGSCYATVCTLHTDTELGYHGILFMIAAIYLTYTGCWGIHNTWQRRSDQ